MLSFYFFSILGPDAGQRGKIVMSHDIVQGDGEGEARGGRGIAKKRMKNSTLNSQRLWRSSQFVKGIPQLIRFCDNVPRSSKVQLQIKIPESLVAFSWINLSAIKKRRKG